MFSRTWSGLAIAMGLARAGVAWAMRSARTSTASRAAGSSSGPHRRHRRDVVEEVLGVLSGPGIEPGPIPPWAAARADSSVAASASARAWGVLETVRMAAGFGVALQAGISTKTGTPVPVLATSAGDGV